MQQNNGDITSNVSPLLLRAASIAARERMEALTDADREWLAAWLQENTVHQEWLQQFRNRRDLSALLAEYDRVQQLAGQELVAFQGKHFMPAPHRVHYLKLAWVRYVAVVILLLGAGAYLWFRVGVRSNIITRQSSSIHDIVPGGQKALLTLADGSTIVLDSAANGQLALEQGSRILKKDGQIIYAPFSTDQKAIAYNTMRTPKGGMYQLTLPDGTRVWLNAASAIKYPTAFTGKDRVVEMEGEVYFEVARNKQMPFKVRMDEGVEVEVLGTAFNVNSYDDEPAIRTTLIEGSVRVNAYRELQMLTPGQQSEVIAGNKMKVVNNADINQAIAWKNGLFNFNGYDLKSVMREIARWYDLEVVYESDPGPRRFRGEVERNLTLNQVMIVLKDLKVNYRLEGKMLIITK